ncbi:hypothetical protein PIB30_072036 [Stylosanthes scabra]|uniref:Uncharacterized protein n=1 Tax=Stylosanthes scabra TaxID=79078 RepID=A0ABU6SP42_9FABA|nr:hypothetical protein [Stylosanthes scabra]
MATSASRHHCPAIATTLVRDTKTNMVTNLLHEKGMSVTRPITMPRKVEAKIKSHKNVGLVIRSGVFEDADQRKVATPEILRRGAKVSSLLPVMAKPPPARRCTSNKH